MCCKKTYTKKQDEEKQTYVSLTYTILESIWNKAQCSNSFGTNIKLYNTIMILNQIQGDV